MIEYQHLIGSALPFPNQPGSGLQLGARRRVGCSGLLELLCKLAEPALWLRAEAAKSDLSYIALEWNPLLAHEVFDQDGSFSNHLVGTGPWQLDVNASQKGNRWVYKKNPT